MLLPDQGGYAQWKFVKICEKNRLFSPTRKICEFCSYQANVCENLWILEFFWWLYFYDLKCTRLHRFASSFSKISGGACPRNPPIGLACVCGAARLAPAAPCICLWKSVKNICENLWILSLILSINPAYSTIKASCHYNKFFKFVYVFNLFNL